MASRGRGSWTFEARTMQANLKGTAPRAVQYMAKATEYHSLRAETYAKTKARWTDRSTNARSGLTALPNVRASANGGTFQIDIFHKVKYGIYLETINFKHKGKLGIIEPTIAYEGKAFWNTAGKIMERIYGG